MCAVSFEPITRAPVFAAMTSRARQVVEVAVAHEDEIGTVDVGRGKAHRRRRWHAVHVRVEEDHRLIDSEAKGRAAKPIECDVHAAQPREGARKRKAAE